MLFLQLLLVLVAGLFIFYLILPCIMVVISFFVREKGTPPAQKQLDLACIITAYQGNVQLVHPLVQSLLQQTHSNQLIYVVADDCAGHDFDFPRQVIVLKPESKLISKVKSFIYAIDHFQRPHDAVVIFDPDNVPRKNFLALLNDHLIAGFKAVQGRRSAKNIDTLYASGDATGEIYKNYIERYIPYLLGSSPTIAGSGMAVETSLFKEYLADEQLQARLKAGRTIVEDKALQNFVVGKGLRISFAVNAVVFDEKVTTAKQAQRQRSRWLYSHFSNLPSALRLIKQGITEFNINPLILGFNTSAPPMFMLLIGTLVLMALSFFVNKTVFFSLLAALFIFIGNIFLSLWLSHAPNAIWRAIWAIPLFISRQVLGLFQMKHSRKHFLVTENKKAITLQEIEKATIKATALFIICSCWIA